MSKPFPPCYGPQKEETAFNEAARLPCFPLYPQGRVAAAELGLNERVAFASVVSASDENKAVNSIMKVPTLVLDAGDAIPDSRMILRYLNGQTGGSFYPAGDWDMIRRESVAEGIIDACLLLRIEQAARPEEFRRQVWVDTQSAKVNSGLDALEDEVAKLERLDAAAIGAACALGYLDFRFADWGWREGRPIIAAWFETFNARPSMQATIPG